MPNETSIIGIEGMHPVGAFFVAKRAASTGPCAYAKQAELGERKDRKEKTEREEKELHMNETVRKQPPWVRALSIAMTIALVLGLSPALMVSKAYAAELTAGKMDLSSQEESLRSDPVVLEDGTYSVSGMETAVLSMYHFDPDAVSVVVKGDDAWLITSVDGAAEASTLKRFDGMAYGPQSSILDPNDETNHTLVEGTPVATVLEWPQEGTVTHRMFILPVDKSVLASQGDIYYMIKYKAGYSATHDGDWYKASGGDYYLTGYTLKYESASTALPGETIDLSITNNTGMFKAVTASAVENADGSATLTFALSGTGYKELYKGTYEQAVANGDGSAAAGNDSWAHGYTNADGKLEFQITIATGELGKDVPVVAVSDSYYNKYLSGDNSLDRAFYPRQFNLDLGAKTLVTGDYEATEPIAVTNNVSMFKPAAAATLECVGGPNSNNYKADLVLPMESDSMSEVFVGTPAEAEEAAQTIAFDTSAASEGIAGTFTVPVKWVATFGKPETLVNLANGEPFVMSFKSKKNGTWYGRTATLDEEAGTLVFDPWVDPAPANTVDELIAKIQSQVFTDTTWADCEAAKAAWDALSDAEKALVEEYDYFGRDTGDASADDPLNADEIGENEILVVSFGTSFNGSRAATIGGVEKALQAAYPDWSVRRAFTAQIIINHIYARDGVKIDNMQQALDRAVANGVKNLVVQPTHLMHGAEYDELVEALAPYQDKMSITVAEPLLGPVGADSSAINDDKLAVAQAVVAAAAADAGYADAAAAAADGAAIVLMGHGTAHSAAVTYEQMQAAMAQLGYANVFIGTVEGEPESTECSNVIAAVKAAGYTKVFLRPLMVVAGDHANNDMADPDDEESWYSQFTAEGNFDAANVTCQIAGLGEIPAVQQIYVAHTAKVLPAPPAIDLSITNNTGMFKAVTASAVENADGSATLTFALSGTGYKELYKGTYEQAVANGDGSAAAGNDSWAHGYTNADGKLEFQITIATGELGKDVPVVAVSDSYYNKYLSGDNSLDRAFYPRQFNLDLGAKTLVTGDYEATEPIAVTNNVSMFKPAAAATLECVGGPNSNNYKADLVLPMESDSMSEVFVGTPAEAEEAAQTIAFDTSAASEGIAGTFTVPVKWVATFGKPETLVNLANGEPFVMSFKSKKNGTWYGRTATLDEEAGTLVFDPWVDPAPANTVDELIAKIQSQVFTDTTWADCEAAKAAWDALSDAEKALVEEYDYFGRDTGDASADDPLNADEIGENEILVVSFGTSFNGSRAATIGGVEKALQAAYPDWSVRRAFTAQIIINHIYARDGVKIDNMQQALDRAVANGVKNLVVQPTHLMHGAEYDELVEALAPYQDKMSITVAEPLLGPVGADSSAINDDKLAVAQAVVAAAAADAGYADAAAAAADGAAIVLMGHGTAHSAAVTYEQMQAAMAQLGYANVFIGTVEGEPESTECSNVIAAVKAAGYTKVFLRPLMVVAGDHANNDMADPDDEESWYSQFTAEGNFDAANVTCQIAGLGEIPAVQQIYVAHTAKVLPQPIQTGWVKVDGKWYYYKDDGTMVANKWEKISGKWYHFDASGVMEASKWVKDSKGWCYLGSNGAMATDKWVKDSKGWCYVGSDGYCVTNQWKKDSKGWCYLGSDGRMVTDKWAKDSKGWCYLGSDGHMVYSKWVKDSKGWCYVGSDGYMVSSKWQKDSKGWCYLGADGRMITSDWQKISNKWYYFDSAGHMVTGTQTINGKSYTFDNNGVWIK